MVNEEIPLFYVKRFEYPEKSYINVTNYYIIINNNNLYKQLNKKQQIN